MPQVFPCHVYHASRPSQVVYSPEEFKALGPGWAEQAFPAPEPEPEADPIEDRFAAIEARLDALEAKRKK